MRVRRVVPRQAVGDRGSTVVEFVLLTSVVIVLLGISPIQAGLWWHERHLMSAAAGEAVLAARAADLTSDEANARGQQAAENFLRTSNVADVQSVAIYRDDTMVHAQVTGTAITAVPGLRWTMTGRAQAPVERFVAQ